MIINIFLIWEGRGTTARIVNNSGALIAGNYFTALIFRSDDQFSQFRGSAKVIPGQLPFPLHKFIKFFRFSGEQLVEHLKKSDDFVLQARGNKLTTLEELPDNTDDERNEEGLENLRTLLGFERIALSNKIVKGVFEPASNRVKVAAFSGKWKIGYFEDSVNYLKPFEALLQVEMGRFEVTFDSVVMSVEQAYSIFLDPSNDVSLEEYAVYSYLMRTGYFVYDYSAEGDNVRYEALQQRIQKISFDKEKEMIWCVLMEKLNLPTNSNLIDTEPELYKATKHAMTIQNEKITGCREEVPGEPMETLQGPSQKRELSPAPDDTNKRLKTTDDTASEENFLDVLKSEIEYNTYRHIFERFSFIRRAENFDGEKSQLKFSFDVFLPSTSFKRSEDLPNYRVIVIK